MSGPMLDVNTNSATAWIGQGDTRSSVSVEFTGDYDAYGASIWQEQIATPAMAHTASDLRGPATKINPGPRAMLASSLSFLGACGESYAHAMRNPDSEPENLDLYPREIAEWAYMNSDELAILSMELEES